MESEPGIGPYEPEPAPIVEPRPPPPRPMPDHYESGHRSKYEHHEEHAAPVGYTEYRRRYEHKRTQSHVVPGGSQVVRISYKCI